MSETVLLPSNHLLAALPADEYRRISACLTTTPIAAKQVIRRVGDVLDTVYFPNGGVASVVTIMADGTPVEAATVGAEGLIGIEAWLNADALAIAETIEQVGDTTFEAMPLAAFRAEMARGGALQALVSRYIEVLLATAMQNTACNALHAVPSRCAKWLLMTHDRIGRAEFGLSHEYLAAMLGVQRPSVTTAAGALQHAGIIRYRRGQVSVLDRGALEQASCDCYKAVRQHFRRAGLTYPVA
jgi:CRP-like cAMP-binding protein